MSYPFSAYMKKASQDSPRRWHRVRRAKGAHARCWKQLSLLVFGFVGGGWGGVGFGGVHDLGVLLCVV